MTDALPLPPDDPRETRVRPTRRRRFLMLCLLGGVLSVALLQHWLWIALDVPSPSMEPHLHGDPEHGDRLVVLKKHFNWFKPERFGLAVFRDPTVPSDDERDSQYLIKRILGLEGENVRIRGGDVYISSAASPSLSSSSEFQIVSKNYAGFPELLVPVLRESFDTSFSSRFQINAEFVQMQEDGILLHAPAEPSRAIKLCQSLLKIDNRVVGFGGMETRGNHLVHDVLLRVELRAESGASSFVARLNEGMDIYRFIIEGRDAGRRLRIEQESASGQTVHTEAVFPGLSSRHHCRIELWNIDDRLGIAVDGEVLLVTGRAFRTDSVGEVEVSPSFGALGGDMLVTAIEMDRDVYYTEASTGQAPPASSWPVPKGHIFVLGDNSEESKDSRHFDPVPLAAVVGRPLAVYYPWDRARLLH